jgi:hypothetical protein
MWPIAVNVYKTDTIDVTSDCTAAGIYFKVPKYLKIKKNTEN